MRNAKLEDIGAGNFKKNVMYLVNDPLRGKVLAHIKDWMTLVSRPSLFIMQMEDGSTILAQQDSLSPIPSKPLMEGKPRSPHSKGSKPWLANYVSYEPSLIKDGVKVLCRNGEELIVDFTNNLCSADYYYMSSFHLSNGKNKRNACWDIVKVFVDPADKQLNEPKQRNTAMKQAHNAAYGGYEVGKWHFWDGKTNTPPVGKDVAVLVWFREEKSPEKQPITAGIWYWKWDNYGSDIIAFKIIEQ